MQFSIKTIALLSTISLGSVTSALTIAFGQELQNSDQTNHWVTWIDGENACPGQQILGVLTASPCDQPFNLGEVEYKFSDCSGSNNAPTLILDSSGKTIGACSTESDSKINCHGDLHDIIKHGTCTIVDGVKARSLRV